MIVNLLGYYKCRPYRLSKYRTPNNINSRTYQNNPSFKNKMYQSLEIQEGKPLENL